METRSQEKKKSQSYLEPERDLLNWEKWIEIRKEEIADIGRRVNRAPVDMIMNQSERVREDKEWKAVLQNAQIDKKATVRGSLWERPDRLKQRCYYDPVYEVHRTREEIGRPRIVEHVGVPKQILESEKGIQGISERKKCMRLDKEFIKYKEKREEQLQEKIKKIDPYKAEIGELFIKGNKSKMVTRTVPVLPEILITPTRDYYSEELSAVYAVRINNTIFIKDSSAQSVRHLNRMQEEKWHEACSSWLYYFNVPVKRAGRAKLFLQNLGTASLRYCWKKIKEQIPFISDDGLNQVFYFNKNEDVLSPGQSRDVHFTFVSQYTVGIYNESWELGFVNVSFFDNLSKKLVVNLQADTVEDIEAIRNKVDILKVRLNRKVVRKLIKTLLNTAVEIATHVEPQICPYKLLLLESELFIMKNPVCYYHQTEVMKLKDFYSEMMPGEIWDLSITTWRDVMMRKDFDDRMKYYNILKQSYAELIKPWNETYDHLWLKQVSVKFILSELANKFDEIYAELVDIINELEPIDRLSAISSGSKTSVCSKKQTMVHMIFYTRIYDQIKMAIEACAGVVSSIDANRWIKFDYCQV